MQNDAKGFRVEWFLYKKSGYRARRGKFGPRLSWHYSRHCPGISYDPQQTTKQQACWIYREQPAWAGRAAPLHHCPAGVREKLERGWEALWLWKASWGLLWKPSGTYMEYSFPNGWMSPRSNVGPFSSHESGQRSRILVSSSPHWEQWMFILLVPETLPTRASTAEAGQGTRARPLPPWSAVPTDAICSDARPSRSLGKCQLVHHRKGKLRRNYTEMNPLPPTHRIRTQRTSF